MTQHATHYRVTTELWRGSEQTLNAVAIYRGEPVGAHAAEAVLVEGTDYIRHPELIDRSQVSAIQTTCEAILRELPPEVEEWLT